MHGHAARIGYMGKACKILVGETEVKRPVEE
jgi:hypothetical protein